MVLILENSINQLYDQIKNNSLIHQPSKVLFLVHADIDALCSLRIFLDLFKIDCLAYEIIPISTYTDLKNANDLLLNQVNSNVYCSIIALNVGGMVQLSEYLSLNEQTSLYLVDSHRPLNLHNLFGINQIYVLDDGSFDNLDEIRLAFEALEFAEDTDDEETEEEDTDDEEEEEINEDEKDEDANGSDVDAEDQQKLAKDSDEDDGAQEERTAKSDPTEQKPSEDSDDNTEIIETASQSSFAKRKMDKDTLKLDTKSKRSRLEERKALKRSYKRIIAEYYGDGTSFGAPITNLVYKLASELGRENIQYLWYSIISMTSNYVYGKMNTLEYTQYAALYKEEVDRLTILPVEDDNSDQGDISKAVKNADDNSIRFIEDLQLMLLKHWNLYDSMFHSTYVGTKLGIWKEKGRQRLTNLLVKMGFPQKESKQFYSEMSLSYKRALPEKLTDMAPRYNMSDIMFPSFEKKYGFITTLSATDLVYSVTALLDCGASWIQQKGITGYETMLSSSLSDQSNMLLSVQAKHAFQDQSSLGEGGLVGAGVGTRTVPGTIALHILNSCAVHENDKREDWVKHFYLAYDALENPRLLQHGILLGIHFQKLLVQTGISILEKKMVQTLKNFQLTILKGNQADHVNGESESKIFGKSAPLLYRLASFLMDAFNEYKRKQLPFIIVALDADTGLYLVMGRAASNATTATRNRKNPFGLAFLDAANRSGIDIKHDFFDSSCIQVAPDDLSTFLENLNLSL